MSAVAIITFWMFMYGCALFLILRDCPWWAALFVVIAACTSIKETRK